MSGKSILKIAGICAVSILLLIPLAMIRGLINERSNFRHQAREDIRESWTGAQTLLGPVLRVPYAYTEHGHDEVGRPTERTHRRYAVIVPDELSIDASLRTETRRRGLYDVPVYFSTITMNGSFDTKELARLVEAYPHAIFDEATLHLAISDNRGIATSPKIDWNGKTREVVPGSGLSVDANGVRVELGAIPLIATDHAFSVQLDLRGMESLDFLPMGEETRVTLDAAWPHPSFNGRFLPVQYEVLEESFNAEWRISHLATGVEEIVDALAKRNDYPIHTQSFGVSLINTVDIYQQAERSSKYGSLFIVLTFTAFFLIEFVRKLSLHPMQYLLVGLALSLFFLLLLSLSEHLPFATAYLIAASACVLLVGFYLSAALRRVSNGIAASGLLGSLYAMLYAILLSESNALLMGSLLLFVALAAVMIVTRRFDWYRVSVPLPGDSKDVPAS